MSDVMVASAAPLRILWVLPASLGDLLDAATYLDTTRELRAMGCEVILVTQGERGQQVARGVEVLCLPRPKVYFFGQMLFHLSAIRLLLARWRTTDVLLFHEISGLWFLPLRLIGLLTGRPRPLLVMDTRSVHMPPAGQPSLRIRLRGVFYKLMAAWGNAWSDGRTAITKRMAEEVGIPAGKLWGVWPSGVTLTQFEPVQTAHQFPQGDTPVEIIYIGAMEAERGLLTLCQAVEQVNLEGLAVRLTLIGGGMQRDELAAYAAQTDGRIRVLPPLAHSEIPAALAGAHVGVLPFPDEMKFRVSSPIKLFEYMAAGLPILATRIVCHTDVIGDGQFVFWAEDGSEAGLVAALRQLWARRGELPAMSARASAAAPNWTWRASADKLRRALLRGQSAAGEQVERQSAL